MRWRSSSAGSSRACGDGKTSTPTSARSWPVITTSCASGASADTTLHAQRAHADPGAGGELEVLGHAAVELPRRLGPRLVGQQPASPMR
jgi:hypothetical protein